MKTKKYLPLYERWAKAERIPYPGLCSCFEGDCQSAELISLFRPYRVSVYSESNCSFWGYGEDTNTSSLWDECHSFTTLRQTIVLLMAAMNDEL
jgi:hypothetical protein